MQIGEHWEAPQARALLVTVHSIADRLDISLERAYGISASLGRFYYGPSHTRIRVLRWRLDQLEELVESGMALGEAAELMYHDGADSLTLSSRQERADFSWGRRRRRRRRW